MVEEPTTASDEAVVVQLVGWVTPMEAGVPFASAVVATSCSGA